MLALPALVVSAVALTILAPGDPWRWVSLPGGGVSLFEWLAGFGLFWLALREAVPGLGVGSSRALLALAGGIGLQLMLGLLIWQQTVSGLPGPGTVTAGRQCAAMEAAIGLPHLAIATWLALRGLPIRPRWSGALAGAAAGLIADSIWHVACARGDVQHLLFWHFGATVAMTLIGAVSGSFWPRRIRMSAGTAG